MTTRRWVLTGLLAALLLALVTLASPQGVRVGAAVVGCLLLPGLGWARQMRLGDRGDTLAMAVVVSLCCTVAVGTGMAVSGAWSWAAGLAVLAVVTVTGFLPFAALADRARAATGRRIAAFGDDGGAWEEWFARSQQEAQQRRRRAEEAAEQANDVWVDWYVDAERRAREEQARKAATAHAASDGSIAGQQQTRPTGSAERRDEQG
jgi:hypothetical protein